MNVSPQDPTDRFIIIRGETQAILQYVQWMKDAAVQIQQMGYPNTDPLVARIVTCGDQVFTIVTSLPGA